MAGDCEGETPSRQPAGRDLEPALHGVEMKITVKLFASFRTGRFSVETKDCAPGTCIADVIRELRISEGEIGMIMVNGRHAEPDLQLDEGASLSLFPLLGGG